MSDKRDPRVDPMPGDVVRMTTLATPGTVRTVSTVETIGAQTAVWYSFNDGFRTGGGSRWLSEWRGECADAEIVMVAE